jgi:hypothetical protein
MVLCRVVLLVVCIWMSLCKLECRSARLCMLDGVSFFVPHSWGHVLSPLVGGSASVNIMSRDLCSFATLRAVVSASSLCVTHVCDLTLPMCVL